MVNITFNTWLVRKDCTREWSFIRWSKSPINFVSKNDMGSLSNLIKKSLTNEMFIRMEICNKSHRRIKSVAVRPITTINSPSKISHIKPILLFAIPKSTIPCVRNGIISWRTQPRSKPRNIWKKYLRYSKIYPKRKWNERLSFASSIAFR